YGWRSAHNILDGVLKSLKKALTGLCVKRKSGDAGGAAPRGVAGALSRSRAGTGLRSALQCDCVVLSRRETPTDTAQSGNGTSIVIPSFATTVSLNTSRASFTNSSALIEYRAETWLRTSRRALAASAT